MEQKYCHTEHEQNKCKPSHGCGCSEGRILHIHYNWPRSCYWWRPAPMSHCCHSDGMLVLGIEQNCVNYHSIITQTIDMLHKKVPIVETMTGNLCINIFYVITHRLLNKSAFSCNGSRRRHDRSALPWWLKSWMYSGHAVETSSPGAPSGQQTIPSHSGEQKPSADTRAWLTFKTMFLGACTGGVQSNVSIQALHDLRGGVHLKKKKGSFHPWKKREKISSAEAAL